MYTPPTIAEFKIRFPEFAALSDLLLQMVLDEAIAGVGPTWIEADRTPATMYLAAHILTVDGHGSGGMTDASTGNVKRRKVGDVETEFAGVAGANSSGSIYGSTSYGARYLSYLRRNFPAIAVV